MEQNFCPQKFFNINLIDAPSKVEISPIVENHSMFCVEDTALANVARLWLTICICGKVVTTYSCIMVNYAFHTRVRVPTNMPMMI